MADVTEVTREKKDSLLLELIAVRKLKDNINSLIKAAIEPYVNDLSKYASHEATLVKEILTVFYPDHDLEGVQRQDLGNGWFLKATFVKKIKVDDSKVESVVAELSNMDSVKPEDIFPQVRKFAKRGYTDLHDSVKIIADKALISKPGNHTIEIVPPKEA
jgi:hypothetical protein